MNKNEIQDKLKEMEQEMADLRKKLDEPELYRGWMPAKGEKYWVTGHTGEIYDFTNITNNVMEKDNEKSVFGIFPTEAEAKASYDHHMAGEECKKIISKWIAKLEPGWKTDWNIDWKIKRGEGAHNFFMYLGEEEFLTASTISYKTMQDEWYFPMKVANDKKFRAEIEPHFRKWLEVE